MIIVGGLSILLGSISTAQCQNSEAVDIEMSYRTSVDLREYSESNYEVR